MIQATSAPLERAHPSPHRQFETTSSGNAVTNPVIAIPAHHDVGEDEREPAADPVGEHSCGYLCDHHRHALEDADEDELGRGQVSDHDEVDSGRQPPAARERSTEQGPAQERVGEIGMH